MIALIQNEMLKIFRRRRFRVVLLILVAVTGLSVFGRWKSAQRDARSEGSRDWRIGVQRRVVDIQNRLRKNDIPDPYARRMRSEVARLQYSLDHGLNPDALNGPALARALLVAYSFLFFPMLVVLFAADLVSAEVSEGTFKLLLTRPVRRWKILASKLSALCACVTLLFGAFWIVAWLISGIAFGLRGFGMPVLTGFRYVGGEIDLTGLRQVPLWQDAWRATGLAWFAAIVVGCLSLLCSIIFRSAAAAIGTMLASLIAGTILPQVASAWDFARYFFVTNLPLAEYYSGSAPPLRGMTLASSAVNLALWGVAALAAAFWILTRRDVVA
jgi:ABC-2 type transport system permease protein